MKKYFLLLPLLLLLYSCSKQEVKKVSFTPEEQTDNLKKLHQMFQQEFNYTDLNAVKSLGVPVKIIRDTVKNIHELEIIDSVFTYSYKDLELHFLKSNEYKRLFLTCATIKHKIELKGFTIELNASQEEVEAVLGKSEMKFTSPESTIVYFELSANEAEEGASDQVTFIFIGNKLAEINYMPYVD